jgi:hypothetical protein
MKKVLFTLSLAFIATVCFSQSTKLDSLNVDSAAKTFVGDLKLKDRSTEAFMYLTKKNGSSKMDISLSPNRIHVSCYVCKKSNFLVLIKRNGHYWIYYEHGLEAALKATVEEFLYVRTH